MGNYLQYHGSQRGNGNYDVRNEVHRSVTNRDGHGLAINNREIIQDGNLIERVTTVERLRSHNQPDRRADFPALKNHPASDKGRCNTQDERHVQSPVPPCDPVFKEREEMLLMQTTTDRHASEADHQHAYSRKVDAVAVDGSFNVLGRMVGQNCMTFDNTDKKTMQRLLAKEKEMQARQLDLFKGTVNDAALNGIRQLIVTENVKGDHIGKGEKPRFSPYL